MLPLVYLNLAISRRIDAFRRHSTIITWFVSRAFDFSSMTTTAPSREDDRNELAKGPGHSWSCTTHAIDFSRGKLTGVEWRWRLLL